MSNGRRRILDEAKRGEVCALVSAGCSLSSAARYVGCDRGTLRREAQRNEEFGAQLRNAEAQVEYLPLRSVQLASATNWRAAAWLLERTRPEQYARAATNLVKMETVHDLIARCLEVIAAELSDTPECQAACRRLTRAIENTCGELALAAITTRDPRRLRKVIAHMSTRPEELTEDETLDDESLNESFDCESPSASDLLQNCDLAAK